MNSVIACKVLATSVFLFSLVQGIAHATDESNQTAAPQTPADKMWVKVLTQSYGPYKSGLKCWTGQQDGKQFCMAPHKQDVKTIDGVPHHFLVLAGYEIQESGGRKGCHACAGTMGLLVMRENGNEFELVARNSLFEEIGSWGDVPVADVFELREIGDTGTYGWLIQLGYTGQGYSFFNSVLHAVQGNRITQIGNFPIGWSDEGVCEDGKNMMSGKGCTSLNGVVSFKSEGKGKLPDASIHMTGTLEGNAYDKVFQSNFNADKQRYIKPDGIPDAAN